MFDDLEPKKQTQDFPRNLETLSVSELDEYVKELQSEIIRVETEIKNKKTSQDAAANIFKS